MKRQLILTIFLVFSLAYALYTYWPVVSTYFLKPKGSQTTITATTSPPTTPSTEITPSLGPSIKEETKVVDFFAQRILVKKKVVEETPASPEKPKETEKPPEPKLEGIWVDSEMKVAFISGQALGVGGTIMGWRVTSISKDRVVLQKGSTTKILKMEEK